MTCGTRPVGPHHVLRVRHQCIGNMVFLSTCMDVWFSATYFLLSAWVTSNSQIAWQVNKIPKNLTVLTIVWTMKAQLGIFRTVLLSRTWHPACHVLLTWCVTPTVFLKKLKATRAASTSNTSVAAHQVRSFPQRGRYCRECISYKTETNAYESWHIQLLLKSQHKHRMIMNAVVVECRTNHRVP